MTNQKIDEAAYEAGRQAALNNGTARAEVEFFALDIENDARNLSRLVGFLDGVLMLIREPHKAAQLKRP